MKGAAPVRTNVRVLLEWAAPYLTGAVLVELETALAQRADAIDTVWRDEELQRRRAWRPSELTDPDRAVLGEAYRRQYAAEKAARDAVVAALAAEAAPGAQLDLFVNDSLTLF